MGRQDLLSRQSLGDSLPASSSLPESPVKVKIVMSSRFLRTWEICNYIAFDSRKFSLGFYM